MGGVVSRRIIRVAGVVQGVGFRPFIYRLARRHGLRGRVLNTSGSVEIDVEGPDADIEAFTASIRSEAPVLARVESVSSIEADPVGCVDFQVAQSRSDASSQTTIPADVATCADCLREVTDAHDRRFAYPFTNCTNCGPRFTIVRRMPYDRPNTTLSVFPMCPSCAAEYADPADRRFHAEPTACPACGPRVWLEADGIRTDSSVLESAGRLLCEGAIVAVKGLGGFHLACDASNDEAVRELRSRKGRAAKPFAVMAKDLDTARRLGELAAAACELITSDRRPIVLVNRKRGAPVSSLIAPGSNLLGLMLPYTPLHHLLFEHAPPALVMTSGNLSEEPLVFTNASARTKLATLADAFVMHGRDIHVPCDDSVIRPTVGGAILMRRARGYVPEAVRMPVECDCVLGTGAEQKNTFCLAWGDRAVLSQHIGDLDTAETLDYYAYAISHFEALFDRRPTVIAHDLHPDYLSTRHARNQPGVRLIGVQHHHAHIASCLAEHGRTDRVIGLALDGTGYAEDGTVWGGEILAADLVGYERIGHLAQVRMPGGEAAIRDPRRMAMAYLYAAFGDEYASVAGRLGLAWSELELRVLMHQLRTGMNSPLTSSAGRLFDAVSAICGVCRERTYEGQPAVELEQAADERETDAYDGALATAANSLTLDTLPIVRAVVQDRLAGVDNSVISAKLHNGLIALLAAACERSRALTGLDTVALSGGVLQNAIVAVRLQKALVELGFDVLVHESLPPNDACISLGQVAVAAARIAAEEDGNDMCLAVPMRITNIDGKVATAEVDGVTRRVRIDLMDNLSLGDYVLVHAGLAIAIVDQREAEETLSLFRGLFR